MEWTKVKACINGNTEPIVDAYSNGTTWNGWDNIALTREGVTEWLDASPYNYRFFVNKDGNPALHIYWDNEEGVIDSTPIFYNGQFVEAYYMNGYCFVVVG